MATISQGLDVFNTKLTMGFQIEFKLNSNLKKEGKKEKSEVAFIFYVVQ